MPEKNPSQTNNPPKILEIDLQTRFGRLKGMFPVPPMTLRLSEFAWNMMGLDDKLISMAVGAEAKEGRKVACQKGCGACCRQAVPLSPAEAWMLADLVSQFPPDRKEYVLERFTTAREKLEAAGFGSRSLPGSAKEEEVLALGLDYFQLNIPCPFLEEESCSIHSHRPSSCREFLVTSSPVNCQDPGKNKVSAVPLATSLTEGLSKLSALLLGVDPQVIPMTLALDWALDNRELGQKRYDATFLLTTLIEILNKKN